MQYLRLIVKLLLPTLILIGLLYAFGFKAHAQEPSALVCVLTPNPEAGNYIDPATAQITERGERYELSGVTCPILGDLMIYKNMTAAATEFTLSASPLRPGQKVGLLTLRGW